MVEDHSLSESARVVAEVVDRVFPQFDQFDHIGSELAKMADVLKDHLKLILPAFPALFSTFLILVVRVLVGHLGLAFALPLLPDGMQTLLDLQLLEREQESPQIMQT